MVTPELPWEHERLVVRRGPRSGVTTMVAIHSTVLGPAIGGCRMKSYRTLDEAQLDVLRLSRAMTDKCAVAGIRFGGAKSVIALEPGRRLSSAERRDVLLDHADLVASFDGEYITGPDVGTAPADMVVLRERTPHVFCLPESAGGVGSSSAPTAQGVLAALRAASSVVFGTADPAGRRVVVSGFGAVGELVARTLAGQGADVTVADVVEHRRAEAERLGLRWTDPDKAITQAADIVVPAAVGGVLDAETVTRLETPLVVGPANNQLVSDDVAEALAEKGVVWVPDYVASAGGAIYAIAREVEGADHETALARVEAIEDVVARLLADSAANGTTPLAEAAALAERRLRASRS